MGPVHARIGPDEARRDPLRPPELAGDSSVHIGRARARRNGDRDRPYSQPRRRKMTVRTTSIIAISPTTTQNAKGSFSPGTGTFMP